MVKFSSFTRDVITTAIVSCVIIIGALYFQYWSLVLSIHTKNVVADYIEGTDGYSGYMFAKLNTLKSKDESEYAKLPPMSPEETGDEFIQGRYKYFKL